MYELEPIGLIVLIFMVAMLLFQKWILLFFKRIHERSVDRYHILATIYVVVIGLLSLSIIAYNPDIELIGFSLLLFGVVFSLKIMLFTENNNFGASVLAVICGILLFFMWLLISIEYLLDESPTIIGVLLMITFFIYWLDLMIRASRNTKRLWSALGTDTVKKASPLKKRTKYIVGAIFGICIMILAIILIVNHHPGFERICYIIDDWIEDSEYKDLVPENYGYTRPKDLEDIYDPNAHYLILKDGNLLKIKLKRHGIFNWKVDEESVKIIEREK